VGSTERSALPLLTVFLVAAVGVDVAFRREPAGWACLACASQRCCPCRHLNRDWVELAEIRLREYFEHADVVDELHTVRFWHLMAMADVDGAYFPFSQQLQLEAKAQASRLGSVRREVADVQQTFSVDRDGALAVVDSNALIHGQWFEDVNWSTVVGAKSVKVVLPHAVIDELDDLSHHHDDRVSERAQRVLKRLRVLRAGMPAHEPVSIGHHATIQVLLDPCEHRRLPNNDAEIIERALFLDRLASGRLVVMTSDNGMDLRATGLALAVVDFPREPTKSSEAPA
jgi:rRNA-processing protein FCF1